MTKLNVKPFRLDDCATGPNGRVQEVQVAKWKGLLIASLKVGDTYKKLFDGTIKDWKDANTAKRGLPTDEDGELVTSCLEQIAQYAPGCRYRDITEEALCFSDVWELIYDWAGIKPSGRNHQTYQQLKTSFNPNDADVNLINFFFFSSQD